MDADDYLRQMVSEADPHVVDLLNRYAAAQDSGEADGNADGDGGGHDFSDGLAAAGGLAAILSTGNNAVKFLRRTWRGRADTPKRLPERRSEPVADLPAGRGSSAQLSQDHLVNLAKRHLVGKEGISEGDLSLRWVNEDLQDSWCLVSFDLAKGGVWHVLIKMKDGYAAVGKAKFLKAE
ncbi:hypothetical protein [Streptomyces sp. NPDC047706]|uniref:hypothetical protein n=1 Tax=Streptomyces sp. NPDC047706 TaxID=3365486 RepID=UPI0037135165